MIAWFYRVVLWLAGSKAVDTGNSVALHYALVGFLTFVFFVGLPVILTRTFKLILASLLTLINERTVGMSASYNGMMEFSGIAAWLIDIFRLPECASILIGALILRMILKIIPFSPVR